MHPLHFSLSIRILCVFIVSSFSFNHSVILSRRSQHNFEMPWVALKCSLRPGARINDVVKNIHVTVSGDNDFSKAMGTGEKKRAGSRG
jgi:hypothetical protein